MRTIRPCVFSDEVSPEFEEAARLSADAGAMGLELRGRMWGKPITAIDDADVERVREVCRRYGVQVAVLGSPVGKCSADNAEEKRLHHQYFERMVELAHAFETPIIRGFALWRPNRDRSTDHLRPDLDEHLPAIVEFLEPIVARAEAEGLRFCLETEGACMVGTCAEANRVMDALGRPRSLGVAWDVNNGLSCGEKPYPYGYGLIRDRVYHVHVKPNSAGSLVTVGDSPLTYQTVLSALRRDGYQDWASIEHWGDSAAMLEGVRQLVPLLNRINSGAP
jgi:sugar phosphate isomerase/epimerase